MSIAIAQTAPAFTLPGVDGRDHSLDDYRDARALVLVQSCNHCPYVQAWEGRLIAIQQDYTARDVRIVAISSNDVANHPEDSFEQMQVRAREQGFNFDYLYDESQSIARALGSSGRPRCSSSTATAGSSTTERSTTAGTRRRLPPTTCATPSMPCLPAPCRPSPTRQRSAAP